MLPKVELKARRDAKNKSGECPLYLQVIFERKPYRKQLGLSAEPTLIDGTQIIARTQNAILANIKIRELVLIIERRMLELYTKEALTHENIAAIMADKPTGGKLTYMQTFEAVKLVYSGVLSKGRLDGLRAAVRKFDKWSKGMPISSVTHTTLTKYQGYLAGRNKPSSVWADMKDLATIAKKAFKNKIIFSNPFDGFNLPAYNQPKRGYLEAHQVESIESYADNEIKPVPLRNVAAWFVFACYSGLRYSDMVAFDEPTWVKGNKLYFSDEKENTPHFIPVHPKLERAIERVRALPKPIANQAFNRYLKELADFCDIPLKITCHVARHTFAVNFLDAGGSIEVLQKFLGHKKMDTTQIYGAITDRRAELEAVNVWGNNAKNMLKSA